jgi:hypothetical protein
MQLRGGQVAQLIDGRRRQVGEIMIDSRENELIRGTFVPGPAFPAVEQLFRDFEQAADSQALSVVDELDTAIAALGLCLRSPDGSQRTRIHDVQIWSDGSITCRLAHRAAVSGSAGSESVQQVPLAAKRAT